MLLIFLVIFLAYIVPNDRWEIILSYKYSLTSFWQASCFQHKIIWITTIQFWGALATFWLKTEQWAQTVWKPQSYILACVIASRGYSHPEGKYPLSEVLQVSKEEGEKILYTPLVKYDRNAFIWFNIKRESNKWHNWHKLTWQCIFFSRWIYFRDSCNDVNS